MKIRNLEEFWNFFMRNLLPIKFCHFSNLWLQGYLMFMCYQEGDLMRDYMLELPFRDHLLLSKCYQRYTRYHLEYHCHLVPTSLLFRSMYKMYRIALMKNSRELDYSKLILNHNLIKWVFDIIWWIFKLDLYSNNMMQYWLQLKCYSFQVIILFDSFEKLINDFQYHL